jgi:two-component system, cell cycle sensor histidine kinase and response regulator CckA
MMSTETLQFLVVEDDEDDFVHVQQLLRSSVGNAEVERATTAEAAVEMANDHPHHLCIVDYRLGHKDGLDVLRELKNRDAAAPVIFLTGQGDEEVAVQAMKAGATDYLLKSKLNAQSLEAAVRHALTLGREQEAVRVARRALYASEQRFRALVENSSDAITLLDAQGTIIYTSQSTRGLLGYAPEELVETNLFDYLHPEDEAGARQAFQLLLHAPGIPFRLEYRSRHKDDEWRCLEAIGVNRLQESAVGAVVINQRDVTERRRAEAERKASADKLRKLSSAVEQSADVVVMTDRNGVIEYVNPAFESLTGYTREETVGRTPRILKSGRQNAEFYQRMWGTLLAGNVFRGIMVNRKKNGEPYWTEKTITPVLDEHGKVRHFISNDRDITERRTAEESLRSSEQRYRLLFERNLAGVYRASAEGKFTEANDSLARMLGYESGRELLGRDTAEFLDNPLEPEALMRELKTHGQVVSYEMRARRKDGSEGWALLNSTLLRDQQGNVVGREGTVLDITERRALQQQLLHSQKMDAVGQLAGGVAHDFNNLLMVISSYAELLSDSICGTNAKAQHQAQEILKAARRAAGLTKQLLAFSRKQVLSPRMLDLNTVLADIGRMLPRLIGENIQVEIRPGASLWNVKADPVQVEQVIMNLAVNARDAMPRGGHLVLETSNAYLDEEYARRHVGVVPGEHVMLTVSDTGCGIPADILPHIFEPFFTTKEQGKGTGLGLPTVYGIVRQSGGSIWVYSEVDRGTVFKVYLPRAQAAADKYRDERPAAPPARGSETVLMVEDEEAVRESTCEYLTSRGYTVLQGKNGADALQVLEHFAGKIHLLITDVIMPGMSGAELGKRVRELRPNTRVIYISGYTESTVVQHGVEAAAGFLQKPFTLTALAGKVREVLDAAAPGGGEAEPLRLVEMQ